MNIDELKAQYEILEQKYDFLMELLSEDQLEEFEEFCNDNGF